MARTKTDASAKLLEQLASLVRAMSDGDARAILQGQLSLALISEEAQDELKPSKKRRTKAGEDIANLVEQLQAVKTREEGFALLDQWELSKADLREIARTLDAAVRKDDNVERLRHKVIEVSIGFKLRSDAIRGK